MTRLVITIDDRQWPKLHMTAMREGLNGDKSPTVHTQLYDSAYTQFEVALHNHLQKMVQELTNRRMQKRP